MAANDYNDRRGFCSSSKKKKHHESDTQDDTNPY